MSHLNNMFMYIMKTLKIFHCGSYYSKHQNCFELKELKKLNISNICLSLYWDIFVVNIEKLKCKNFGSKNYLLLIQT